MTEEHEVAETGEKEEEEEDDDDGEEEEEYEVQKIVRYEFLLR